MRPDLYFTEKEFIKFIEENVSDDDIRMMFENANLEKDETVTIKGEKTMGKLIVVTSDEGKKYCIDRTLITGIDYYYYKEKEKEYTILLMKNNPCLIVRETMEEVIELIEKSEAKEKGPIIYFIKLTGADDKKDVYVNVNKINAISSQNKRIRVVCISDQLLLVLETVEEILAKIEEVTK